MFSIADLAWTTTPPCPRAGELGRPPRQHDVSENRYPPASSAGQVFSAPCSGVLALFFTCFLNFSLVPPTISESCTAPNAIDCGGPNRDDRVRGAVSLPGSKSDF
jgi:hypothetical protein